MRFKALQTLAILIVIAEIGLAAESWSKAAIAAMPASGKHEAAAVAPTADLFGKSVLVLHGFEANMPLNIKIDQGIRVTLEAAGMGVKQQFFEYLDLARNPNPEHCQQLVEMLRLRYAQRKIDFLITLELGALEFLLNEGQGLFPGAPVLALDLPPTFELPRTNRRIIQQFITYDMMGTLEEALKLVPGAKRVYVVIGAFPEHDPYIGKARRDFKKWEGRLEFRYLNDRSFENMLTMVSHAPSGTIVLYLVLIKDITGKIYNPRDAVRLLSRASAAPVFGLYDTLLGYGIVGGSLVSFEQLGIEAAKLALEFLVHPQSRRASRTVLEIPSVPMFDWRQLRHWNLSEDALPEESIIINRQATLWEYKYYIFGGLAFIIAQSFLILGLRAQQRRRRNAERSLWQKSEQLDNFFSMNLDLLCIADTEGYFLRLNPTWEKTLGYSLKELMSRRYLEFVHPDDVSATRNTMQALASHQQVVDFTNRYRTKDGAYRHMLWSAVAFGNRIFASARDMTEHLRAEAMIHEREQELQILTGRLILNQEEERRRVARELHDDLSQRLAVLAIAAGRVESAVQSGPDSIRNPLIDIRDKTIQIAADVQNISRRLHPSILEDLGLSKAIEAECHQFAIREGIEMSSSVQPIPRDLPKDVSLSIYRIVQEGLNNIAKYSCARCVTVSLSANETALHLTVSDDGVGFDPVEVRGKAGLGLSSIRERVRLVYGTYRITSNPEKGTTIEVTVPLKPELPTQTVTSSSSRHP
jgi:PAS domain S-box-containing protein